MIGEAEKAKLQVGYKQAVRALNENNSEKLFISEETLTEVISKVWRSSPTGVSVVTGAAVVTTGSSVVTGASVGTA